MPLLVLLFLVPAVGCRKSEEVFRPVLRLTELEPGRPGPRNIPRDLPVASLRDPVDPQWHTDTRYVLRQFNQAAILYTEKAIVEADGAVTFLVDLPAELRAARRLILRPQVRVGSEWQKLQDREAQPEIDSGRRRVRIRLEAAGAQPSDVVGVHVEAFEVKPETNSTLRTAAVAIPVGARLGLALGIPRLAWEQGPVSFQVEACRAGQCKPILSDTLDPSLDKDRGWQDRSVSLDEYGKSEVSFTFTSKLIHPKTDAYSFVQWAHPTVYAPVPRATGTRNVILLSIDTLRADHLTTYGFEHDTSPFMQETFGKHGAVFEHCVAASVTTPPSHMTMFTGVQPCVHGLTSGFETLPSWLSTVAERLWGAGIETGAVTEDGWLGVNHGFSHGFSSYIENSSPDVMAPEGQVDRTFKQAKRWLGLHRDKPFFLFLHTFQVHDPYEPPPQYRAMFPSRRGEPIGENSPRWAREDADYAREIRFVDDQLRDLFATLGELGLTKNTVFIVTSDHGEEFFEHGHWGHGAHFNEEITRVPLMLWGPGAIPEGLRIETPVGHIDFAATVLELAGAEAWPQSQGTSLVPLLHGKDEVFRGRRLFSEAWANVYIGPQYDSFEFGRPGYAVRAGALKATLYPKEPTFPAEAYDLRSDPDERRNLQGSRLPELEGLNTALKEYEASCMATAVALQQKRSAAPQAARTVKLGPAEEEKLRALGYLK